MHIPVIAASSPFRLSAKMLTHNKKGGPDRVRPHALALELSAHPFANGPINPSALTPSASAWKFSTTR